MNGYITVGFDLKIIDWLMYIVQETNNISVTIDIEEVLRINDKDYSITFSTYFNVEWKGNTVIILK